MNLAIRLVVAAGLLLFYTACLQITDHDPSDAELLRNFAANRETLDSLVTMCQEDPQMIRIAPEFTWKKDNVAWPRPDSELGITKERWDFYRELFTKAKIKGGLLNYQPDSIMMVVSTRGAANSGSSKGYAYLAKPPQHLQASLDNFDFKKSNADGDTAYRHIEGNWYIFFDVS